MQIWIFLPPVNKKKSYWEPQYSGTKLYNLTSEETFFKPNVLSTWLHFSNQSPQARESTSVFDLSLDRNKLIETVWSRPSCNLSHNLEWSNHIIVCTVPTPGLLVNKTKVLSKIDLKCVTYLQYMVFILYYNILVFATKIKTFECPSGVSLGVSKMHLFTQMTMLKIIILTIHRVYL